MFTKLFWKDAAERAGATIAQVLIPFVASDTFDLFAVNWELGASTVVSAGVLSLAKSVVAHYKNHTISPASLVSLEEKNELQ